MTNYGWHLRINNVVSANLGAEPVIPTCPLFTDSTAVTCKSIRTTKPCGLALGDNMYIDIC